MKMGILVITILLIIDFIIIRMWNKRNMRLPIIITVGISTVIKIMWVLVIVKMYGV